MNDCQRPRVLVPVADGTEEIEAVCIIDVLRRAGADVTVAGVGPGGERAMSLEFRASRGVRLVADAHVEDVAGETWEAVLLPGGLPGATHLRDCAALAALLVAQDAAGRLVGAICAAPVVVLQERGLLRGRGVTCFPALRERLEPVSRRAGRVVQDGNLLTSQGPGTALEFALAAVAHLFGHGRRAEIAAQLLMP
ncbi:DJ-1/PfpI family protein [bacterium]|nr:DJ-1/PfpI family protein [bacterium]